MSINEKQSPESYWISSTDQPVYPELDHDEKVDIAIIGGGIAGIATAYMLSRQGLKLAVLEAGRILQGTTGHTTAKITSQHGLIYSRLISHMGKDLATQYAQANETAIRMIQKIAVDHNIDCDFTPESAYVYTMQDKYVDKISDEVQAASSLGIKASFLESIPLGFPVKGAVRFEDQARYHPRKFLIPLSTEIIKSGSMIYENTRIVKIEDEHKIILITSQGKRIIAEKLVIASHYPCLNKPGFYFARIYAEKSYVLAIKAKEKYPGGMYITAEDPGRSLRSQMSESGELILIGGEHHKTGQGGDTMKHYQALSDFANEHFTLEKTAYRWSTQDCMTLDQVPYVGQFTPANPNIYVATGFGKWGMTNGIASAMLLKDLILSGTSPWKEIYSPSRHSTASSIGTLISQNANVASELIKGKNQVLQDNIEIGKGECQIIEAYGERAGAYRDEQGQMHIVNTTCTHMGCELQWNSAETSWDCPCHGSRFSIDGEIIEGPAVQPLSFENDVNTFRKLISEKY